MRHRLRYALIWVAIFAVQLPLGLLYEDDTVAERVVRAAVQASVWTALAVYLTRTQVPRPTGDEERGVRWRTYDGDRPRTWRSGWAHRSGAGFVVVPMTGEAGPRVQPGDVVEVRERAATRREARRARDRMRVLELDLTGGKRADLVLLAEDAFTVRRWLAA